VIYILDTNICIYIINKSPKQVLDKFLSLNNAKIAISIITYGELLYGIQKSNYTTKSQKILDKFANNINILNTNNNTAKYYGEIRSDLSKNGNIIGNNDLWIAAHAKSLNAILVTNNEKEFNRIDGLRVENWLK
jgi:tRNA(fMet)-specific endonuclease VapC